MAGYTRNDTSNNIATGNVIDASDLDGEFDAIQAAFNSSTGHNHDGTTGEGAPIEAIGPTQDVVATASVLRPKTDDAIDLGSATFEWKDAYIDGTLYADAVDIDGGAIDGATIGANTAAAGTFTNLTATGTFTLGAVAITATGTELNYVDGVTSNIQDQLDALALPSVLNDISNLAVTDGNFIVGNGSTWVAESGSTVRASLGLAIGTNVQAYNAALQSISGLTTSSDKMIYTTASNTYAVTDLSSFARTILDDADASAVRTTLGVAIGTNVQAYDAGLQSISGLTTAANKMIYTTASDTYAVADLTAAGRALLDDADASAQRTTLGLGTAATLDVGTSANNIVQLDGSGALPAVDGSALTGIDSGGMRFIATADASNDATIEFTGFNAALYDSYLFVLSNVIPASDNVALYVRSSTDGGSSFSSTSGDYHWSRQGYSGGNPGANSTTATAMEIAYGVGSDTDEDGYSGHLFVYGPHLAKRTRFLANGAYENLSGVPANIQYGGYRLASEDVDAIQFLFSSGNIESGTITMYGLRNS